MIAINAINTTIVQYATNGVQIGHNAHIQEILTAPHTFNNGMNPQYNAAAGSTIIADLQL